jgi:thymidylate synthase
MNKKFHDIHGAYLEALRDVWYEPQFVAAPRGLAVREILNYTFTVVNPKAEPIRTLDEERNKVIAEYTAKEVELYNSCTNRVEDFAKASKFWEKLANPDGTVNSAYGYLIWKNKSAGNPEFEHGITADYDGNRERFLKTPWEWAKQSLIQDKDTRQAILRFSLPEHSWMGNKDFTCTMHGNFLIRNDKLHLTVIMRSNDLMKGLVYDLPWFVSLMDRMIEELKPTYPELTKGNYTHLSHSMHIYEKDGPAILKMLGQDAKSL